MFIELSAPPSAPLYDLVLMPKRSQTEDWVDAIRIFIRDTLGNKNWQIRESKGKARLGIRFDDGTRTYKNIPYKWLRSNQNEIRHFIEAVHYLHIKKKVPIDEAVERVKARAPKDALPKSKTDPQVLLDAWKKYGDFKINTAGDISESTWIKGYAKTYRKLEQVAESQDAINLLKNIGKFNEPGSRSREENVQRIASFLRWATSKESGYLLDAEVWNPPPKFNLQDFKGKKSRQLQEKTQKPTTPIEDNDLFRLIESLNLTPEEKKHRQEDRAKEWSFAVKLMATYGLRPIEVQFLEVRRNGKDTVWCTYAKKSGGGIGQARRVFPLHPTWEKNWNLIQKIKNKAPLPRMKAGAGESFKNYMRFNPVWKELKEKGCSGYSFRHAWAMRSHIEYGLHPREAAPMMGHSLESHQQYSRFFNEELLEDSFERAIKRRKATHTDKS